MISIVICEGGEVMGKDQHRSKQQKEERAHLFAIHLRLFAITLMSDLQVPGVL